MTDSDIGDIMQMKIAQIAKHCVDPDFLVKVLAVAVNAGIRIGLAQANQDTNEAFKGYDASSITN